MRTSPGRSRPAPTTTSNPASTAAGIRSISPTNSSENTSTHTPWSTAERRLTAPAATLVELRTITPLIGSPPSRPETALAAPWPISSRSRSARRPPGRSLSMATADIRLSRLATAVSVATATSIAARLLPSGRWGSWTAPASDPGRSMRATGRVSSSAAAVSATTATSGAGTTRTCCGIRGQASSTATTPMPTSAVASCTRAS